MVSLSKRLRAPVILGTLPSDCKSVAGRRRKHSVSYSAVAGSDASLSPKLVRQGIDRMRGDKSLPRALTVTADCETAARS
jgi:hypothetical protein